VTRRFDDRVAVVTGGAAGIGLACAYRLADDGAAVVIADIDDERGEVAAAELRASGHRAVFAAYDASVVDDAEAVVRRAIAEFGRVDIGVASAGIVGRPSGVTVPDTDHPAFLRLDVGDWEAVWAVNVTGAYAFVQACGRAFVDQSTPGSIVVLSSTAAADPTAASNPHYAMSKAAVTTLVRGLSPKLAPLGIRLNAVGPGITETSMSTVLRDDPERLAKALGPVPMRRLAKPSEIAAAVTFLASDAAAFVTGESLYVDGGFFTG
jgi:glucose 1-dehydrogenase